MDELLEKDGQESLLSLEKMKNKLKVTKVELATEKQRQDQISTILNNKISDYKTKLSNYESLETKLKRYEAELSKEKELSKVLSEQLEAKKKDYYDGKMKSITEKTSKIKLDINKREQNLTQSGQKIKQLRKELNHLNENYAAKVKMSQAQSRKASPVKLSQYSLPKLQFSSDVMIQHFISHSICY